MQRRPVVPGWSRREAKRRLDQHPLSARVRVNGPQSTGSSPRGGQGDYAGWLRAGARSFPSRDCSNCADLDVRRIGNAGEAQMPAGWGRSFRTITRCLPGLIGTLTTGRGVARRCRGVLGQELPDFLCRCLSGFSRGHPPGLIDDRTLSFLHQA
jgi:hypothetical protein